MKVAIIGSRGAHSTYGGIEKVLGKLCPRLAAMGHDVHVFCERPEDVVAVCSSGVHSVHVPAWPGKFTETISRSLLATVMALSQRFDVINFVAIGPGILSVLPRLVGTPVVVSIHGLDWAREKWSAPARIALRAAERAVVSQASEITVVSHQLGDYFRTMHGRETVHTPNGIDLRSSTPNPEALASLGLEQGGYVAFASRLVPEKGAHELIAAFNRIDTDKKLVIAGGGRYDQSYVDSLKAADTTGRVVFTGHLTGEPLDAVFQGAYLYALPSHVEGLSLSLLEAMGFGKATLVSDIPENVEVVGDCGFRFPVGNVDALTMSLAHLLRSGSEVAIMGERARTRASKLYSWDSIAETYSAIYNRLARGEPSSDTVIASGRDVN